MTRRTTAIRALFLAGATASGKTSLAVEVAQASGAEIVSCDSRQIYRGMRIGTAAPTADEMRRAPHHLVGVVEPREAWSAGRWAEEATRVLADVARRGRPALIVGGSGLYARALRRGLAPLPRDPALRTQLERESESEPPDVLHARLARLDPEAAAAIHPNNRHRLLRALEVCLVSGRPMSALWRESGDSEDRFPAPYVALETPREVLNARIDRRVEEMFAGGLLEETRGLLADGFAPEWPSYRTLGYPEAVAHVRGERTREDAVASVQQATRAFAKRQATWLRGERDVDWLSTDAGGAERAAERLLEILEATPRIRLDAVPPTG